MAKRRQPKNNPPHAVPVKAGSDLLGIATLVAVVLVLVVSIVTLRAADRLEEDFDRKLERVEDRIAQLSSKLSAQPVQADATPPTPTPRRGPDPEKVYSIRTAGAPAKGPSAAPITIAEFSDFQCPFCARVGPTLQKVEETYGDRVRLVWKHFPLESLHPKAPAAHLASVAAQKQGKFWEFHDKLFANQKDMEMSTFVSYAEELGLDVERFQSDLADLSNKQKVEADIAEARSMELTGTPAFFVNGRFLRGAQPFSEFARVIDEELERLNQPLPADRQGP